jgi:hypothetical protein
MTIMLFIRPVLRIFQLAFVCLIPAIFAQTPVDDSPVPSRPVPQSPVPRSTLPQGPAPSGAVPIRPAQNAGPVYAVLSLIGDRLDVVSAQQQIGSRIDKNYRTSIPITDAVFDNSAITAAGREIVKLDKRAEIASLNTRSPVLFAKHRELFAPNNGVYSIPAAIKDAIVAQKATHFILITKYNDEAVLTYRDGYDGVGRLEGLGFYLDTFNGRSVIVPYVYIKLVLVEVASGRLLNTRLVRASIALRERISAGTTSSEAWAVLTSAEKVQMIDQLLRDEIVKVVPDLIQGK